METSANNKKVGRLRRGWELTKSSWRVLTLDKELMTLPIIGFCIGLLSVVLLSAVAILLFLGAMFLFEGGRNFSVSGSAAGIPIFIFMILFYMLGSLVSNYFSGAIIYGATQRFRGGDPTVRSSLAGAARKLGPLAAFSVVAGTVGLLLQTVRDRVPFVGQLLVNLGGLAWSIATVFAVPVIVLSDEKVGPIEATKESVNIIRKIWGEGLIAEAGVAIVTTLGFVSYIAVAAVVGAITSSLHPSDIVTGSLIGIGVLGLLALLIVFNTLSAIARAAMYHYATTGEAPEAFNKDLLQASMTVKKARRIFA